MIKSIDNRDSGPMPESHVKHDTCPLSGHGELVTVAEAARFLRVSLPTMYALIWEHRIEAYRPGRAYRISVHTLHRYLESSKL